MANVENVEMNVWTLLVYMAADNDLGAADFDVSPAERNLRQIATAVASNANVGVVTQIDRPHRPTERFVFEGKQESEVSAVQGQLVKLNPGEAATLTDFLVTGRALVPPSKYTAVVLWGHAMGFVHQAPDRLAGLGDIADPPATASVVRSANSLFLRSFGGDSDLVDITDAQDFLDNDELDQGLNNALPHNDRFDIIGCDACLMGTVEVAHQLRKSGTYYIASQDNELPAGWPYDQLLGGIRPGLDPHEAAAAVVDTYGQKKSDATLSAIKLYKMFPLAAALNRVGDLLLDWVRFDPYERLRLLAEARRDTRTFANYDYIDLGGYLRAVHAVVAPTTDSKALQSALDIAIAAVKDAVLATTPPIVSDPPPPGSATGLSVYIPNGPISQAYRRVSLTIAAPRWRDFVTFYGAHRERLSRHLAELQVAKDREDAKKEADEKRKIAEEEAEVVRKYRESKKKAQPQLVPDVSEDPAA